MASASASTSVETTISNQILTQLLSSKCIKNENATKTRVTSLILDALNRFLPGHVESQTEELRQENTKLKEQNTQLEDHNAKLEDSATKEREDRKNELNKLDENIQQKDTDIADLKKQVAALETDLRSKATNQEHYVQQLQDDHQRLEEANEALEKDVQQLNGTIEDRDKEIEDLKRSNGNFQKQIKKLTKDQEEAKQLQLNHNKLIGDHNQLKAKADAGAMKILELEKAVTDKDDAIADLENQLQQNTRTTQTPVGSFNSSSTVPTGIAVGNEIELSELRERNEELEEELAELNKQIAAGQPSNPADIAALQKKLDDAQAKIDELTKSSSTRELQKLRDNVASLQKRERELMSQLKAKKGAEGVEAALAQLQKDKEQLDFEIEALKEDTDSESNELKAQIDRLKMELIQVKRSRQEALDNLNDTKAERYGLQTQVTELEKKLSEANTNPPKDNDLAETLAAHAAQVAEYEKRIAQLNKSKKELTDYCQEQMRDTLAKAQSAQEKLMEQVNIYKNDQEQIRRQASAVGDRITANPGGAEVPGFRRRESFLKSEVQRLVQRIQDLQVRSDWFEDLARSSQTALEAAQLTIIRGEIAAEAANTSQETMNNAIKGIAEARRARNGAGPVPPPPHPAPAAESRGWSWSWNIPGFPSVGISTAFTKKRVGGVEIGQLFPLLATFVVLSMVIVEGRELATWRNANPAVKRGLYASSPDRYSVCLSQPSWPLLWEFFAMLVAGKWMWSA